MWGCVACNEIEVKETVKKKKHWKEGGKEIYDYGPKKQR